MKKNIVVLCVIVIWVPILGACWNQKELTDLAIVMAVGIDKGKDKNFKAAIQLVNPGNVSSGQGGQGGGQGLPIAVYISKGDTLTEAARNATKKISRRLYYAHANALVVSEAVARENMLDVIDALERDPEFRTTTQLLIARGNTTAEELVASLTILDKLPVMKITKELQTTEQMLGENMQINIDDFITSTVSDGREPFINGYRLSGIQKKANQSSNLEKTTTDAFLEADGLGVFKKGKLIGWIDHEKARGVVWILGKVKSTQLNLDWKKKKNAIAVATIRSKTKVSVQYKQGRPFAKIKIDNEGWVSEANTNVDLTDPKVISKLEKLMEKKTAKQIIESVKAAQKLKSDVFGFGDRLHRSNPRLWNKIKGDWGNQFAHLKVDVTVDSYIRREGIRNKPFWSDLK